MRAPTHAASLLVVFVAAKTLALCGHRIASSPWTPAVYLWQDAALVLAMFGVAAITGSRLAPRWWTAFYLALVVHAAINVGVVRVLATPLTWAMLRATSGTLADSMASYVTPLNFTLMAIVLVVGLVLPRWLAPRPRVCRSLLGAAMVLTVAGLVSPPLRTRGLHRNAIWALVGTALPASGGTSLGAARLATSSDVGDLLDLTTWRAKAAGRSVLLVVLESTGAKHLGLYGAHEDPMPTVATLAQQGLVFERAYAAYPESIRSFAAIHQSVHPAIGMGPEAIAALPAPGLAQVLRDHGYRTGLFHSGRFRYLGMDAVVRDRGFARVADAGDIGGDHESSFGIDERSTVASMLAWLDQQPDVPFFLVWLPIAGHHPYHTPEPGPFDPRTEVGCYHNALHYADAAFADLLAGLMARGQSSHSVVVVVGDHGEAFGEHDGNVGHTFALYEENLHVPLVFAGQGLTQESVRAARLASHVDLAPTILDLLGLEAQPGWEGASLLDRQPRLILAMTDYSLLLGSVHDGPWKCILDVNGATTELYHLTSDPEERRDRSGEEPVIMEQLRDVLLGWLTPGQR